jgi:fibronectin type 3 domain-containing protein
MADLNPEVFEDLQVAEQSRPLFKAAGLALRTWEAYCLAFNERNLLRREITRIHEGRGSPEIHPEVLERLRAIRTEFDPIVGELRKFLPPEPDGDEERERQEMILGFITVSPTARDVASKWIADPARYKLEATQKLQLIENVVERYRRALRAEIDAQMTSAFPKEDAPAVPTGGAVTRIVKRPTVEPLPAPASLEGAATNGEISLIWSPVPGATEYAVKRSTRKGGPYSTIARPAQDCYADPSLQNGTTYFYVVSAVDETGVEGRPSPEIDATPLAPPAVPAGVAATPGNGCVALAWRPSAGAAQYRLLRAVTPSGPFAILASTKDTAFNDTTVANGTTYFYAVVALNAAGESPASGQTQTMPVAPPPAPVGLSATPGDGRVALAWTHVHGASSYTVLRADVPEGPFTVIAGPITTAHVDATVVNGSPYFYAVAALNAGGESQPGSVVAASPIGPPAKPSGLTAASGNGEIMLAWAAVSGAASYTVRRAPAADGPWTPIANPAGPAYTDTGLANGTEVFYSVAALNAGGESAASGTLSATPIAAPAVPTGLAAAPGNTRITLTWHPSAGATSYVLKRGAAPGGLRETIATPQGNSHTDLLLTNDATYYYTLAAKNPGGESAPSAEVSATPVAPPDAPADLEASPGNGCVTLRWRPVANTDRYRVMRSTTPGGPYTAIANPAETTYLDAGATNGMTYYYVIRATNDGGKGAYSAEAQTTPVAPPAVPTALAVVPGNANVALSWNPVPGATSYAVRRAANALGPFLQIAAPASPAAIDVEVTNGTTYYYAVSALNAGGESALSPPATASPLAPPAPVSGLDATPANGLVTLGWSASPRAAGYTIRRATSAAGPFEPVGSAATTAFSDSTVTNGTTYHYVVIAQNAGGESDPSTAAAALPMAPPPAPTGLQVSAGGGRVSLSWSPTPRATSYSVRRATAPGGPYSPLASLTLASHVDADVSNGSAYYYVVTALNVGGVSPESAEASALPVAAPGAVTALEATAGNGQVALAWPASDAATGYFVKRALTAEGPFAPIATVPTCSHVDPGLTNGTPYHYRVSAMNAGGEGAESAVAAATPVAPPAAPTGLAAAAANREITLTWATSARATSYLVKRAEASGGPHAEIATAVGLSHQDTGLENGKSYFYVVTAVNAGGESAPSAETQATPVDPPATPTGVAATAGNNQVLINWTAVPGATYYRIKRATDKRGPYVTVGSVSRITFIDGDVENGQAYFYVVHSLNAGGRSAHSTRVSATPVPPPPAPLRVIALAGNFRVSLTWEGVETATGYSIKRATDPNGPWATVARVPQTSYLDAAVSNGTTYYYRVRSATGVVKGPLSVQVQATPSAPPAVPTGLAATPGHGTIALAWNAVPGATCYHVKRSNSPKGPFETVASPDGPAWEDIGLANGIVCHYRVSADNAGGESADSAPVLASPVAPPAVPTGLRAIPASGEVTLAWIPVAGASQYRVKRSASGDGPFAQVAQPAEAGYTDTGLANGTAYHYVVSAVNAHGESLDSFPAHATPVGAPRTPTGLLATPGSAKIDLAWSAVPFAVRYRVMRAAAPGGPYVLVASPRDASYSDCPLTNGIPQYYVVSAVNSGGESPNTPEISAAATSTPAEPAPKAPPAAPVEDDPVPSLESIPMPSAKKLQGVDLERLLDLRRVEQLRTLFDGTGQKFEEWEVLCLIAEDGFVTRQTMELLLRLKNKGDAEAFTSGAVTLFEKILKIRAQFGVFVRKLRAYLGVLDVKAPSREILEIALSFILQAPRGRSRAEKWIEEPDSHAKAAGEYMKMAYAIAQKYRDAL